MTTAIRNTQIDYRTKNKRRPLGHVPFDHKKHNRVHKTVKTISSPYKFKGYEPHSNYYINRIETLMGYASEEGIVVNNVSVKSFHDFINTVIPTHKAMLAIMDNGNLRAIWKGPSSRLALEFMGNRRVHCVVSKQMNLSDKIFEESGEYSFNELQTLVDEWGLRTMVSA